MRTFSEFQIIGRVGKINTVGAVLKVSLAADYGKRNNAGDYESNPFWNSVTIFNANTIKWVNENLKVGDLVHTRGTIRETQYTDRDGEVKYGTTLAANDFDLLSQKSDGDDDQA